MSLQTDPSNMPCNILKRVEQTIEGNINYHPILREEMKQTIHELLDQIPKVKLWNDELHDNFLQLDRYSAEIKTGENIQKQLHNIKQLLLNVNNVPKNNDEEDDNGENHLRTLSSFEEYIVRHADNPIVKSLRLSYDLLDEPNLKLCLLFLAIFPKKAVLKKKLVIYWWIGEGLVRNMEEGDKIFDELIKHEFIKPYRTDKCPKKESKFQIHPWIRYMLITVGIEQRLLHLEDPGKPCFDPSFSLHACLIQKHTNFEGAVISSWDNYYLRSICNVSAVSLNVTPKKLAEFKKLVVLQLGQWQHMHSVPPNRQIQVRDDSFLSGLNTQKQLKYLSLRGISRISNIPDSIISLVSLEILDLKACHNLEKLPSDISPLKKLTHLDVSQCYMLESMPTGIEKLTSLKVLDGFIIGNSHKIEARPFKIDHFLKMSKLEKLGIHIARGKYLPKDLHRLKELGSSVKCLKISWASVTEKDDDVVESGGSQHGPHILTFPPSLTKLKLEGIPFSRYPEWLKPSNLKELKELHIKGDKLNSLFNNEKGEQWKVELLILKYTKDLEIDGQTLKSTISSLKYVKKVCMKESSEDEVPIESEWLEELQSKGSSK